MGTLDEARQTADGPRRAETDVVASKQAVVVIHGIGEQVPLETLRSFVETVYQRDTGDMTARPLSNDPDLGVVNQVWAVPDDATGTAELRRISTPPDEKGVRTDFFEFYWADIMEGTPIEEVYGWLRGLLLRSPFSIPRDVRVWIAWLALWGLSIAVALLLVATIDPTGVLIEVIVHPVKVWLGSFHKLAGWIIVVFGVALGAIRYVSGMPLARVRTTLPTLAIVAGLLIALLPDDVLGNDKVWSAVIAAALALMLNGIVAPYAGDIVRYVRATPKTVDRRRLIRERGMKLLDDLHGTDGKTGAPIYDRVVIVAHSLGTIIGYDLIQLYWEKEGPTHHKRPLTSMAAGAAYAALDEDVRAAWVGDADVPFDLARYRERQATLAGIIGKSKLRFRITDFITLGAALNHASFLVADDEDALKRSFEERYLSSAPPRPDGPKSSMIYWEWPQPGRPNARGPFLHFASAFASVRWTNLYDKYWLPLFGDIVSGPLADAFGPGVEDRPVTITRPGWFRGANRFFTHTLYWTWHPSYANGKEPEHIKLLRAAIRF